MKRILPLLLSLLLMLSLAACAAPAMPAQEQAAKPVKSAAPPEDEYERAIWYGFVPGELAEVDPGSGVAAGHLALPENWEAEGYSHKNGYYYDEATLNAMRELYGS